MSTLPRLAARTSSTAYDPRPSSPAKPTVEKLDVADSGPSSLLPPPAVSSPGGGRRAQGQVCTRRTRIKESAARGLQVQWQRLLRRFGAGAMPSSSSADIDTESVGEASAAHGSYSFEQYRRKYPRPLEEMDYVDEVVVDREWGEDVRSSSVHSGHGGEKSGTGMHGQTSDADSVVNMHDDVHGSNSIVAFLRYRLWSAIVGFFVTQFVDEKSEDQYRKENWFLRKVRHRSSQRRAERITVPIEPSPLVCRILHLELGTLCHLRSEAHNYRRQNIPLWSEF